MVGGGKLDDPVGLDWRKQNCPISVCRTEISSRVPPQQHLCSAVVYELDHSTSLGVAIASACSVELPPAASGSRTNKRIPWPMANRIGGRGGRR